MNGKYMKNRSVKKVKEDHKEYKFSDFDLDKPGIIQKSMQVKPKYGGKLSMLKTSVSLPRYLIDDLCQMARIKGMSSYQAVLRKLLSEKIYEEKQRLGLF